MSDTILAEDVSMEIHLVMPILVMNVCMGLIIVRIIGSTREKVRYQMQIVIEISADNYRKVQDGRASVSMMQKAIGNGTPLPKGHGRLIDESDLIPDSDYEDGMFYAVSIGAIHDAQTIIEKDGEDKE